MPKLEVVADRSEPWALLRAAAEETIRLEPHLASQLNAVILSHNDLASALSFQIARKLGDGELGPMSVREICRDAFDVLYREGATQPKMMSIGLHMRIIGQPARVGGLEKFLDYIQSKPDVWITRRVDIARHWRRVHPSGNGDRRL